MMGREVLSGVLQAGKEVTLELPDLSGGLYILQMEDDAGGVIHEKLFLQQ